MEDKNSALVGEEKSNYEKAMGISDKTEASKQIKAKAKEVEQLNQEMNDPKNRLSELERKTLEIKKEIAQLYKDNFKDNDAHKII